jgi:hypothetical protein
MTMERVESGNIREVGHDPASNTLRIRFIHGGTYDYFGVPAEAHADLMAAASKGQHFHQHIRGRYAHSTQ